MSFGAVILAAGASRRMGPQNKLLLDLDGKPIAAHVLEAVQASGAAEICIVIGHEAGAVQAALEPHASRSVRFLTNSAYRTGFASSLVCGLAGLAGNHRGVAVCLGDMPFVTAATFIALYTALQPGDYACAPVWEGEWGNPVLLSPAALRDAMHLTGDRGARVLLRKHVDRVRAVPAPSDAVLRDIDRERDLGLPDSEL